LYASQLGKSILPILADDVTSELIPHELAAIQYVDYRQKDKPALLSLVKALGAVSPSPPLPEPLPTAPAPPVFGSWPRSSLARSSARNLNVLVTGFTHRRPLTTMLMLRARKRRKTHALDSP
jgi:hypothetical protein